MYVTQWSALEYVCMYVQYVCIYVCLYVCIYVQYVCFCVCMFISNMCVCKCAFVSVYVCLYVSMYVYTHTNMCMYVSIFVCMWVSISLGECMCVCQCLSIYVCMWVCLFACLFDNGSLLDRSGCSWAKWAAFGDIIYLFACLWAAGGGERRQYASSCFFESGKIQFRICLENVKKSERRLESSTKHVFSLETWFKDQFSSCFRGLTLH